VKVCCVTCVSSVVRHVWCRGWSRGSWVRGGAVRGVLLSCLAVLWAVVSVRGTLLP
jgi:hypothetical protein